MDYGIRGPSQFETGTTDRELAALRRESDPLLRGESLLAMAGRLRDRDFTDSAANLYQQILEDHDYSESIRSRADSRLAALRGEGSFADRLEHGAGRFLRELTDPSNLLAMTAAGSAFRLARFAALGRLAAQPALPRLALRGLAGLAGFGAEAIAFPLALRLGHWAQGRELEWSHRALRNELAVSFLSLGGLRAGGLVTGALARRQSFLRPLLQQSGMLGGILLGQGLEMATGLRDHRGFSDSLADSLSTLVFFNVAGRLHRQWSGEGIRTWERRIETQSEALTRPPNLGWPRGWNISGLPALAVSTATPPPPIPAELLGPDRVYMTSDGEGSGVRRIPRLDVSVDEYRYRQVEPEFWRREIRETAADWASHLSPGKRAFEASIVVSRLETRPTSFRNLMAYLARYNSPAARLLMLQQGLVGEPSAAPWISESLKAVRNQVQDRYAPHQISEAYEQLWLRYANRLNYSESEFELYDAPLSSPESYERFAQTPDALYQALLHLPLPELFMPMMSALKIFPGPDTRLP